MEGQKVGSLWSKSRVEAKGVRKSLGSPLGPLQTAVLSHPRLDPVSIAATQSAARQWLQLNMRRLGSRMVEENVCGESSAPIKWTLVLSWFIMFCLVLHPFRSSLHSGRDQPLRRKRDLVPICCSSSFHLACPVILNLAWNVFI